MGAYALPLPVTVICDLLGVPAGDREDFHAWSNELVTPTDAETAASSAAALTGYLTDLIARKARTPDGTLLADLATPDAADAPAPEELLGMAFLLLVAGHETTVNLISATVLSLLTHPEQLALLRADPELTGAAVEESLRLDSPVHAGAFRFAAEPLELAGTRVAAGDAVLVSLAAASATPSPSPTRTASTSPAAPRAIWASDTASTTASAPRSPARRPPSPCVCCWNGTLVSRSTPIRTRSPGGRARYCGAHRTPRAPRLTRRFSDPPGADPETSPIRP